MSSLTCSSSPCPPGVTPTLTAHSASREATSTVLEGLPIWVCLGPRGLPGRRTFVANTWVVPRKPGWGCWLPTASPQDTTWESAEGRVGREGRHEAWHRWVCKSRSVVYTPNGTRMAVSRTALRHSEKQAGPPTNSTWQRTGGQSHVPKAGETQNR